MERKTKIVCTIGPACASEDILKEMILKGMNVARFNFSHTSWDKALETINLIKSLREKLNKPVAIMMDMKGPEIRLGEVEENTFLEKGSEFTLKEIDMVGDKTKASISYKDLAFDLKENDLILIDDGLIKLKVKRIINKDIVCEVIDEGFISSYKSVNVPNLSLNLPSLNKKDYEDLDGAMLHDIDYIAASFVRRKEDILAIKNYLKNKPIKVIAKLENKEGIDNFKEILDVADGIMVARGDLGVEIPFSLVPIVQKKIIRETIKMGKPVITATQMLESMINKPRPTRAEVSDCANAIYDGTSALMLSAETASGKYPLQSLEVMEKVALDIENDLDYWSLFQKREINKDNFEFVIDHALLTPAKDLNVKAIFAYSLTGDTPRILASMQPKCPIYVVTNNIKTYYELSLVWGINVTLDKDILDPKEAIKKNIMVKKELGLVKSKDIVLIAGGKYMPGDNREVNKNVGGIFEI